MMEILPNSDGSIWKPPGTVIQDLDPLTEAPSGLSTATSPRSDTA